METYEISHQTPYHALVATDKGHRQSENFKHKERKIYPVVPCSNAKLHGAKL